MPEEAFHGKNKPLTSEELPKKLEDAINSEGKSIKVPVSSATKKAIEQEAANAKKAEALQAHLNRNPNLTSEQRLQYETKIGQWRGFTIPSGSTAGSQFSSISIQDAEALLQQLQHLQKIVGDDWRSVLIQWQNLQGCWQDPQYDLFEPFFEALCRTYAECERQCEDYAQFLEARIRGAEDATATLNM